MTYLTDIVGSIVADDLEFYRVEFARSDLIDETDITADNPAWKSIGESSNAVTDSVLAEFDPLLLMDDSYWIRVLAQDKSGNIGAVALPVSVAAPAKLGQFSLEFTDLSIPLAGIPITISRSYNTLHAGNQGDFGFGWTLDIAQADLRETVAPGLESQVGLLGATPFTSRNARLPDRSRRPPRGIHV